jgi:hypothetical protein
MNPDSEEPSYYAILNVPPDASDDLIRRAYRQLATTYHPDKHQDPQLQQEAAGMFTLVQEAYEVRLAVCWRSCSAPMAAGRCGHHLVAFASRRRRQPPPQGELLTAHGKGSCRVKTYAGCGPAVSTNMCEYTNSTATPAQEGGRLGNPWRWHPVPHSLPQ